jgi:HlyD family secretion protein
MKRLTILLIAAITLYSCKNDAKLADAYGNFESDKTVISAEAMGKILKLDIEEGDLLKSGQVIGLIDTLDLHFKKSQLLAQINSVAAKSQQIDAQSEVQKQQLENISIRKQRVEKLFAKQAATQQQVDDIQGQFDIIQKQIIATETQRTSLSQQLKSMQEQLKQIQLAISKCEIINPVQGTILNKLSMQGEMAIMGKPLYTISDLEYLKLKAYVLGSQLSEIKLGQKVKVLIDGPKGELKEIAGKIIWISESAEFTPKTIQTREERVNLVYAIKVKVKNDGSVKIGMPGEVIFSNEKSN